MSAKQLPPWVQEQLMKMQQSENDLQLLLNQRTHLELEKRDTDRALEELKKAKDDAVVFKHTGSILMKSTKRELIEELEEKQEMANTRTTILAKQEDRLRESLKAQGEKLDNLMKSGTGKP